MISVVIPVRNELPRLAGTIRSIAESRTTGCDVEIVVVDDASEGHSFDAPDIAPPGVSLVFDRLGHRAGVPGARNHGASLATGDVLFMTDAHVAFSSGWDACVLGAVRDNRILAATIADPTSAFRGYGCSLLVPFMGTSWNRSRPAALSPVHIPSCTGTVLPRDLFRSLGGYDRGMLLYGGAEPEFGLRAWLSGAEVVAAPEIEVWHRFKSKGERQRHVAELRQHMVHNHLRFGMLYLGQRGIVQMLGYYAELYPEHLRWACAVLADGDVWERRARLERTLAHDFDWFVDTFDLKDQEGGEIIR